jgi:tetraacyldisaccharide 4'-kinase
MDEAYHRALVSGDLKGVRPALLRGVLSGLAIGYGLAIQLRAWGYSSGLLETEKVPVPVISLGNITTGGTGKTPLAAFVAQWFRDHAVRVAFLSRGYGADPGAVNDEALVLNQLCPDVPHLQNPDRVAAARIAIEELESQLLILDDGFQHRRLGRDLDIVLIDATNPWGYGALLPRGLLREPLSALRRASVVVLTRVDGVTEEQLQQIRQRLKTVRGTAECVETSFPVRRLVNSQGETADWSTLAAGPVAAFCGIGNPTAFQGLLARRGLSVAGDRFRVFPDHHRYSRDDVYALRDWSDKLGSPIVLTTQKDLVKLDLPRLNNSPLWAVEIGTEIHAGQDLLERHFTEILQRIPPDEFSDPSNGD